MVCGWDMIVPQNEEKLVVVVVVVVAVVVVVGDVVVAVAVVDAGAAGAAVAEEEEQEEPRQGKEGVNASAWAECSQQQVDQPGRQYDPASARERPEAYPANSHAWMGMA